MSLAHLPASIQEALKALAEEAATVLGKNLQSVALYGHTAVLAPDHGEPVHVLFVVERLDFSVLDVLADRTNAWHRRGVATPLVLPRAELDSSLDVFPLEYADMIARHVTLYGPDPFTGLSIDPADLRRQVEVEVKGKLIHLREGFLEASGAAKPVSELLVAASASILPLIRHVLQLGGVRPHGPDAVLAEAAKALPIDVEPFRQVLALRRGAPVDSADAISLYHRYLVQVERLAAHVDGWRAGDRR